MYCDEALFDICRRHLGIESPTLVILDRLLAKNVHPINPEFLDYSAALFRSKGHLVTQGFRGLLVLMHSCAKVHVYGFDGGPDWYFDKERNRGRSDKDRHRSSRTQWYLPDFRRIGAAHRGPDGVGRVVRW